MKELSHFHATSSVYWNIVTKLIYNYYIECCECHVYWDAPNYDAQCIIRIIAEGAYHMFNILNLKLLISYFWEYSVLYESAKFIECSRFKVFRRLIEPWDFKDTDLSFWKRDQSMSNR